jgi:NOL1/NOP2/fmu family ribosome biogenesis protein
MLKLNKLTNKEIKSIKRKLEERHFCQFENDYAFFSNKERKVYIVNKKFLKAKIKNKLNSIGIYFCKYEKDGIRLSIEGSMLMKNPKKNVIKLNKKQFEEWMKGNDLEIKHPKEYVLLEYDNMVVGCGKSNEENIRNFIPKSRRMHIPKDF